MAASPLNPGSVAPRLFSRRGLRKSFLKSVISIADLDGSTSHTEDATSVVANFIDIHGEYHSVRGKYLVGCDGGSSRVRRMAGIKMSGGPMYVVVLHVVMNQSRSY